MLRIPARLLITSNIVELNPRHPLHGEYKRGVFVGDELLIVLLLFEALVKGEKSFWKPYLDMLPKDYGTPEFWM